MTFLKWTMEPPPFPKPLAEVGTTPTTGAPVKVRPMKLDAKTGKLIELLFDRDMFKQAMANLKIDGIACDFVAWR